MHDRSLNEPHLSQELRPEVSPLIAPEQRLFGTEFLTHLRGAEQFYETTRDRFMGSYPFPRTQFIVVWGRTGAGKRTAISQLIHRARNDQELNDWLAQQNTTLDIGYVAFAESANLAKLEGNIDPNKKHGQYNNLEYRAASDVMTRFALGQTPNYENPRWVFIEASGPAAQIDVMTGEIKGPDRGFSTVHQLGKRYPDETRVLVINRDPAVARKIIEVRREIEIADPGQLPKIFDKANMRFARKGIIVDLYSLPVSELKGIKHELLESQASSEGVIRSNRETDELKREMGIEDEEILWIKLLNELNFNPQQFDIVRNLPTDEILTIHQDELHEYDIVLKYAQWIERLKNPPRGEDLSEIIGRNVVNLAVAAGDWIRRDFRRLRSG